MKTLLLPIAFFAALTATTLTTVAQAKDHGWQYLSVSTVISFFTTSGLPEAYNKALMIAAKDDAIMALINEEVPQTLVLKAAVIELGRFPNYHATSAMEQMEAIIYLAERE